MTVMMSQRLYHQSQVVHWRGFQRVDVVCVGFDLCSGALVDCLQWLSQLPSPDNVLPKVLAEAWSECKRFQVGDWCVDTPAMPAELKPLKVNKAYLENEYPGYPSKVTSDYFQQAVPAQRREAEFMPGEPFMIEAKQRINGRLPSWRCRVFCEREPGQLQEADVCCDTLQFMLDSSLGLLTYRLVTPVASIDACPWSNMLVVLDDAQSPREMTLIEGAFARRKGTERLRYAFYEVDLLPKGVLSNKLPPEISSPIALPEQEKIAGLVSHTCYESVNLSKLHIRGLTINNTSCRGVDFAGAIIEQCCFIDCDLRFSNWQKVTLDRVSFINCDFRCSLHANGIYLDCVWRDCRLDGSEAQQQHWQGARFISTQFAYSYIARSNMVGAYFQTCEFKAVHWHMLNANGEGVAFDACRWENSSCRQSNLASRSWVKCVIHNSDFTESDLSKGKWRGCRIKHSTFDKADLGSSQFADSVLIHNRFHSASLINTQWHQCHQRYNNLNKASTAYAIHLKEPAS